MDVRRRHLALVVVLAIVAIPGLAALIDAAGKGAAVMVSVTAMAALFASYVWIVVLGLRSPRDEDAKERLLRWGRAHMVIMIGMPVVLIAAHPWGPATIAVGGGMLIGCHFLYIHTMLVASFILKRRARSG